jgi:hypothetical protein
VIPQEGSSDPPGRFRFRGLLITGTLALVAAAAIVAVFVRMQGGEATSTGPSLLSDTQLRAAPRPDAEVVASLAAHTALDLLGRSEDNAWLIVAAEGQPGQRGWVPLLAVRNAGDLASLPAVPVPLVATARPSPTASASVIATPSPTVAARTGPADLRIQQIGSRDNRLLLTVTNVGSTNSPREVEVSIEGEQPQQLDLGRELAPGDTVEVLLSSVYVQRRASVTVTLTGVGGTTGNSVMAIVEPDQPNDLELLPPVSDAADGHLVVTLRNNSPIPVLGTATISVREPPPSNRLVARYDAPFDLPPEATTAVDFTDVLVVDPLELSINVSTDAITDAELGNNIYPR